MIDTAQVKEKVILIGVATKDGDDTESSLLELKELVETAGGEVLDIMIQNRDRIHSATYLGKGKIEELKERIWELDANAVVTDDELSPAQLRNLENLLDIKLMDRTMVILDIFAKRAMTREGKLQVELAQLKYSAVRLVGLRSSLSRLGGGIGTRGPGEKKIEMDRRLIHDRISTLKEELAEVVKHRELARKTREDSGLLRVAIVGYTNAGKSTLLNTLTDAKVLSEDKVFATLDPTTRQCILPSGQKLLLTDTVGFIRKLPHHLVEAFKSTLEEAKYADIIIHLVDASNKESDVHMLVVYETLKELGVKGKEIITIYNKMDKLEEDTVLPRDFHADYSTHLSLKTGMGMEELYAILEKILRNRKIYLEKVFSYAEAGRIQEIRRRGELLSEEYTGEGIEVKAYVPVEIYESLLR